MRNQLEKLWTENYYKRFTDLCHQYGRSLEMIVNSTAPEISLTIPADAVGREWHLILEVWDDSPIVPLVDYRRAVISVPQPPGSLNH